MHGERMRCWFKGGAVPVLIAAERPRCWRRFWSEELSLTDPMEFPPVVGDGELHWAGAYSRPGTGVKLHGEMVHR